MKFCKDCKHYETSPYSSDIYAKCKRPGPDQVDPVSGKVSKWFGYCSLERRGDYAFICGLKPKYFEPKDATQTL